MRALAWCAAPVLGRDGRPSFSKLVLVAVLTLYALKAPLPQLVAIAAMVCSYGWKGVLAFLERSSFGLQAVDLRSATTSESVSHETKDINVHVASDAEYDWEAGIDRRQP